MLKKKQRDNYLIFKSSALGLSAFLVAFAAASTIAPVKNTSAADDCTSSVTDEITCTKNQNLNVTVNNNPLYYYINVVSAKGSASTPIAMAFGSEDGRTAFGNIASASDSVYVETNSPLTHQLMLSTTGTYTVAGLDSTLVANNLVSSGTVVNSGSLMANTFFAPGGGNSLDAAAALGENTWGFALENDSEGIPDNNFDADYSSPALASKWVKVPNSGSEIVVRQDNEPVSTTDIYYGVRAEKNIAGGEYSNVMLYTALAEQPSQIRITPSTATAGTTITIYTSINTTNITDESATVTFYQLEDGTAVDKATCGSSTVALDTNNYLYVTCTVPTLTDAGTYGIKLSLSNLATTLSQDGIFTYSATAPQSEPQSQPQQVTQNQPSSVASSRSNIAFAPAGTNSTSTNSTASSDTSSDSDGSASSVYNSPLGADSSDKTASTVAATKKSTGEDINPIAVAAIAAGAVAVGVGVIFAMTRDRDEDEEETY